MRAVDKAYAVVRDGVIAGRFPPGNRITEQEVALAAGVSRTPAREALRRLHQEGVVDFTPNQGAVVTEYYDRFSLFGNDYLQVVTVVTDPTYLTTPFVVSNQFKREPDDSKWNPTPCATDAPLGTFQPPGF